MDWSVKAAQTLAFPSPGSTIMPTGGMVKVVGISDGCSCFVLKRMSFLSTMRNVWGYPPKNKRHMGDGYCEPVRSRVVLLLALLAKATDAAWSQ